MLLTEALAQLDAVPVVVPMRLRFRRVQERHAVLLRGPAGWGEWSPFAEYDDDYAARWLLAAVEAATVDFPPAVRDVVPLNASVPAVGPEQAAALVRASGASTAKVKVAEPGQSPADDLARVEAVRDALGPDGHVRVDANAAWGVDEAARRLVALDRAAGGLQYAEQPVPTLEEMARLRRLVDVPLAADESVRTAADPLRVAGLEAADVVVVKVQPLGGVRRTLAVVEAAGLPAVVSSALETSVGLAAGLAVAAALPDLPYACGLGTAALLADDVVDQPLLPGPDGGLRPRRVAPDPDRLAAVAAPPAAASAMLARLRRAAQAGDRAGLHVTDQT